MTVALDRYSVDWLTLTTFSEGVGVDWKSMIMAESDKIMHIDIHDAHRMQYSGFNVPCNGGSIFWGRAEQGKSKRNHWMIQVTGSLADDVFFGDLEKLIGFSAGQFSCTRIDFQVTHLNVEELEDGKNSIGFMKRVYRECLETEKSVSWIQDKAGSMALATIGINKRTAPAYCRVYPKRTAEGDAIRFEMEFKREKALAAFDFVRNDGGRGIIGKVLRKYSQLVPSDLFREFFDVVLPVTAVTLKTIQVETGETNTVFWLMTGVLPAYERIVATDGRGNFVARAFMDATRRALGITGGIDWEL